MLDNLKQLVEGERVKVIRKSLNLTQDKFAARLGLKRNTISQIESGVNNVTEQMRKSICREFNVSYAWLTEGIGDMFNKDDDFTARIDRIMAGESEIKRSFIKALVNASEADLEAVDRIIDEYIKAKS